MRNAVAYLFNGLSRSILLIMSLGLPSLIVGIINMAHGEMLMLGVWLMFSGILLPICWLCRHLLSSHMSSWWLARSGYPGVRPAALRTVDSESLLVTWGQPRHSKAALLW
jgi:branched-subunit amino acid ABC-type transport system permease component